jgi:hypothetical protein
MEKSRYIPDPQHCFNIKIHKVLSTGFLTKLQFFWTDYMKKSGLGEYLSGYNKKFGWSPFYWPPVVAPYLCYVAGTV